MPGLAGCKIQYHAQDASGKMVQSFGSRQEFVAIPDWTTNDFMHPQWDTDSIVAVLNSNGKGVPAGSSLVIDGLISMEGAWTL